MAALVQAVQDRDRPTIAAIVGPEFAELIEGQGGEANTADRDRFLAARAAPPCSGPTATTSAPSRSASRPGRCRHPGSRGRRLALRPRRGRRGGQGPDRRPQRARGDPGRAAPYVDAQVDYASEDRDGDQVREYAQRLGSTPGLHDGLYWPVTGTEEPSPFGPFLAAAGVHPESREAATPYYGYLYRIMQRQGANAPGGAYDYVINGNMIAGFAMVAWPAEYGESGS